MHSPSLERSSGGEEDFIVNGMNLTTGGWSHDQVLFLIELVKERPVIYNVADPGYKNRGLRQVAMEEVCREMQTVR